MRTTVLAFSLLGVVFCAPAMAQPPPPTGGGGTSIENAGSTTSVDTAGEALTFKSDGDTIGSWLSNLGESLLTVFGQVGQTGPILSIQEDGGKSLDFGHDGTDGNISVPDSGADVNIFNSSGFGIKIPFSGAAEVQPVGSGAGLLSRFSIILGPSTATLVKLQTCGDRCGALSTNGTSEETLTAQFDVGNSQGVVTIDEVLALVCVATAPASPAKGWMYCDTGLTVPCFYNGTNWVQMDDFSTVCS